MANGDGEGPDAVVVESQAVQPGYTIPPGYTPGSREEFTAWVNSVHVRTDERFGRSHPDGIRLRGFVGL